LVRALSYFFCFHRLVMCPFVHLAERRSLRFDKPGSPLGQNPSPPELKWFPPSFTFFLGFAFPGRAFHVFLCFRPPPPQPPPPNPHPNPPKNTTPKNPHQPQTPPKPPQTPPQTPPPPKKTPPPHPNQPPPTPVKTTHFAALSHPASACPHPPRCLTSVLPFMSEFGEVACFCRARSRLFGDLLVKTLQPPSLVYLHAVVCSPDRLAVPSSKSGFAWPRLQLSPASVLGPFFLSTPLPVGRSESLSQPRPFFGPTPLTPLKGRARCFSPP